MTKCRLRVAVLSAISLCALGWAAISSVRPSVVWNRTDSAPKGLYWVTNSSPQIGDWAALSSRSPTASWISTRGFAGDDWPIIKQVAAMSGAEICRHGTSIFINGSKRAEAILADGSGLKLPAWHGCRRLLADEVFLLSDHPRSLDGRYFGPETLTDLDGVAVIIWRRP